MCDVEVTGNAAQVCHLRKMLDYVGLNYPS